MIRFSNEDGFLELTTLDENGSGVTFPSLIRLADVIAITDISHIDDSDLPGKFKNAKTLIQFRHMPQGFGVLETKQQIIDQVRRP